jgi:hypothetical protein
MKDLGVLFTLATALFVAQSGCCWRRVSCCCRPCCSPDSQTTAGYYANAPREGDSRGARPEDIKRGPAVSLEYAPSDHYEGGPPANAKPLHAGREPRRARTPAAKMPVPR